MSNTATESTSVRNNKHEAPLGTTRRQATAGTQQQRIISTPNDVASLVLMQVDAVNAKKDELTIAIKGLADLSKQLVRAYAQNAQVIQKLQTRAQALEKEKQK
jgi:hypothetical protein